jgi:hypothetical protein
MPGKRLAWVNGDPVEECDHDYSPVYQLGDDDPDHWVCETCGDEQEERPA